MRKRETERIKLLFKPIMTLSRGRPVGGVPSPGVPGAGWSSELVSPGETGSRAQSWTAVPPTVKGKGVDWDFERVVGCVGAFPYNVVEGTSLGAKLAQG